MRVREASRRIPGNSIGKGDSTTGPIKNIRASRMADNSKVGQRSSKHTGSPWVPTSIYPRLLPHRKTTHRTPAEEQNLQLDRTMHGGSKGAHPTNHHATSPNPPR